MQLQSSSPAVPELQIPHYSHDPQHVTTVLERFSSKMLGKSDHFLGYQVNESLPPIDPYLIKMMNIHMNNAGDPFVQTTMRISCKEIERAVMDYCADLWNEKLRDDLNPNDPDNYWGYVLNMGSTEGNLNGLWNAREYIRSLSRKKPVVLCSNDTHYSVYKSCDILQIKTDIVRSDCYGRINLEELMSKVKKYVIKQNRAIICVFTLGTTFTGAYDQWHLVINEIKRLCQESDVPNWIHLDGALGGFMLPFIQRGIAMDIIKKEKEDGYDDNDVIPQFGFDGGNVQSLCASFYKWFGAPYPCGTFMTHNKYLGLRPIPQYIASPDTTIGGGRNAFTSLYIWWRFSLSDYNQEIKDVKYCLSNAKYLYQELNNIDKELGDKIVNASRAPYSVGVTFNSPSNYIANKYSIPHENGRSHIYTMKHVSREIIGQFIDEFRSYLIGHLKIKGKSDLNLEASYKYDSTKRMIVL